MKFNYLFDNRLLCVFQYGSDEFGQESPRYTSPKTSAALYTSDPYYLGNN